MPNDTNQAFQFWVKTKGLLLLLKGCDQTLVDPSTHFDLDWWIHLVLLIEHTLLIWWLLLFILFKLSAAIRRIVFYTKPCIWHTVVN